MSSSWPTFLNRLKDKKWHLVEFREKSHHHKISDQALQSDRPMCRRAFIQGERKNQWCAKLRSEERERMTHRLGCLQLTNASERRQLGNLPAVRGRQIQPRRILCVCVHAHTRGGLCIPPQVQNPPPPPPSFPTPLWCHILEGIEGERLSYRKTLQGFMKRKSRIPPPPESLFFWKAEKWQSL